jgi:hypothetical protein
MTRTLIIGFFAVAVLMCAGLVSTQAKAAPTIPTLNQQSLVEDVGWRRPFVRRPYARGRVVRGPVVRGPVVRGPVVRGPVVRRPVRRIVRPWRWF